MNIDGKSFELRGGNQRGFEYCQPSGELVLSGPAGTGKTLANLLRILHYGSTYPRARMLIVRKTRKSLTESALVTWEDNILGAGHPVIGRPINRGNRHQYTFPNASVLVTGGMDRPDKILSTEWDLIYVPETTDLSLLEWEQLSSRLRAGNGPYDLIFGDCNPTTPTHWIYQRAKRRKLKLIGTVHQDNPRFWDDERNEWTADGIRYQQRLKGLTGARRARFLKGLWVAAEGLVYGEYKQNVHMVHPRGWVPPADWRRAWGLDFGYSNPMSLTMWAIDGDDRMHLYREYYLLETRVEILAKRVMADFDKYGDRRPDAILCDHDPENAATFQTYTGLTVTQADKTNRDEGIQSMQGRFDLAGDNRPRVYLAESTLAHQPEERLIDAGKPTCLSEELIGYVWDTRNPDRLKDEPLKMNDHACDGMRYVGRWADTQVGGGEDRYGSGPDRDDDPYRPAGSLNW